MRKLLVLVGVAVLSVTLTGCRDREVTMHRDAEFREECLGYGGTLERNMNGDLFCEFVED